MKAKKVYEFQQGQNPYDTMGVGSNRPYEIGDKLKATVNLYKYWYNRNRTNYSNLQRQYEFYTRPTLRNSERIFVKDEIYKIMHHVPGWESFDYFLWNGAESGTDGGGYTHGQFSKLELNKFFKRI
jgi:hypothetical protein